MPHHTHFRTEFQAIIWAEIYFFFLYSCNYESYDSYEYCDPEKIENSDQSYETENIR